MYNILFLTSITLLSCLLRDEELLKNWRMESKRLQQKKYFESMRKGTKGNLQILSLICLSLQESRMKAFGQSYRLPNDR